MKKRINQVLSVGISMVLASSFALPVKAEENTSAADDSLTKDETVYALLNSDGSVSSVSVSEWLHSDSGLSSVKDNSILNDVVNTKTEIDPVIDGESLTWNTDDHDVYYTGKTDKQLPISVSIDYSLDGVQMSAEDITGKSGELAMTIHVENSTQEKQMVNGKNQDVAVLFPYALLTVLSTDSYSDVKADDALIMNEGKNQIVGYVSVSGASEILDQLNTVDVQSLTDKIKDSFTISMHVEDATIPSIMLMSLDESDLTDTDIDTGKLDEVQSGIADLQSATKEILDGTSQLADANVTLDTSMQEFQNKYGEFASGLNSAKNGADSLASGAKQLDGGLAQLESGLNAAMDATTEQQIATIAQQLTSASSALTAASSQISSMSSTMSALSSLPQSVKDGITGSIPTNDAAITQGVSQAISGNIDTNAYASAYCSQYVSNYVSANADASASASVDAGTYYQPDGTQTTYYTKNDDDTYSEVSVDNYAQAAPAASAVIDSQSTVSINQSACVAVTKAYLDQVVAGTQQAAAAGAKAASDQVMNGVADAEYNALSQQLVSLQQTITDAQTTIQGMSAMITQFQGLLTQEQTLISGISALPSSVHALHVGSTNLLTGANSLASGMSTLNSSSGSISSAISQFKNATGELVSATGELKDGVNEFSEEGINKLCSYVDDAMTDINDVIDLVKASEKLSETYSNYAGAPDGAKTSVKFVLKTSSIAGSSTASAAAKDTETKDSSETANVKTNDSIIDKIRGLFQ